MALSLYFSSIWCHTLRFSYISRHTAHDINFKIGWCIHYGSPRALLTFGHAALNFRYFLAVHDLSHFCTFSLCFQSFQILALISSHIDWTICAGSASSKLLSSAVVTPVKYECGWNNLTCTFARSKILLTEKLTNRALVTPTPVAYWGQKVTDTILLAAFSSACRRCSNYIFILNLTSGFSGLDKDNCKMRRETFKFGDLVHLILEVWQYSVNIFFPYLFPGLTKKMKWSVLSRDATSCWRTFQMKLSYTNATATRNTDLCTQNMKLFSHICL